MINQGKTELVIDSGLKCLGSELKLIMLNEKIEFETSLKKVQSEKESLMEELILKEDEVQ
jgi:hypothetical protein